MMANFFSTVSKLAAISNNPKAKDNYFDSGIIDYLINITKNGVNDYSADNAFDHLNKFGEWVGKIITKDTDVKHNRTSAALLARSIRALNSMALLRSSGAMNNRTQTSNIIIHMGLKHVGQGFKELHGARSEMWKAAIQ